MATVRVWDGTAIWQPGVTPFGFYDDDPEFQRDAPKFARFAASRLGWPMMDVELQSGSFFTALEEAVTEYGNQVYEYKVRENYMSLEGGDVNTPINDMVVEPSLQRIIEISKNYGTEAEVGGNITLHKGFLELIPDQQDYDLDKWAREQGVDGGIEIRKIYYEAPPAILRYFDPYAGTGTGIQSLMDAFDFGSYSPGVNFLLMPVSADLLQIQAIEFNDQVRKSTYSFRCVNNQLTLFPVPKIGGQLRIEYYKLSDKRKLNTNISICSGMSTHKMNFSVKVPVGEDTVTETFTHNLGTTEVTVQVFEYDEKGTPTQMIPAAIDVLDDSTISVTFAGDTEGYLVIGYPNNGILVSGDGISKVVRHCIDFSVKVPKVGGSVSRLFTHNLKTEDLNIQVFKDEGNKSTAILPEEIKIVNENSIRITFNQDIDGHIVIGFPLIEQNSDGSRVITNISEVPYKNPTYSKINSVGKQWIFRYALAIAKEMLAYVRGKYTSMPIPNSEATLNQQDLLTDARDEKNKLIEQLRDMLDQTSRQNQLDRKAQESENLKKVLSGVPMCIYIG